MHDVLQKKLKKAKGDILLGIGSILVSLFFILEADISGRCKVRYVWRKCAMNLA